MPPPSRPRYNNPDYDKHNHSPLVLSITPKPITTTSKPNYGTIINNPNQLQSTNKVVSSLATKYIPNVGNKYVAVVPTNNYYNKVQYLNDNDIYDKQDKLNGRYNYKLKKYKAYEQKLKYVPYYLNVVSLL